MARDTVALELSSDEALVLFELIARLNKRDDLSFDDQAEQRVLWDIEAMLERELGAPLRADYSQLLADARARVRDVVS
jgi:hypothetical protein